MKKILAMFTLLLLAEGMTALPPKDNTGNAPRRAQRKFQILVENQQKVKTIQETNNQLMAMQESSRGDAQRGLLSELLFKSYSSSYKQKTVNASSNLVSLGLSYVTQALKSDREKWYSKARQQCSYTLPLGTETRIDDFYALPSTKGAMDPENLKFEGFGCKNYIEVMDGSGEGIGVFYIFCKMRRDSIGLRHIINHSKFLVEVDSLVINPRYCNLPNDSTGNPDNRFDFAKRSHLKLNLKVRLFSSWMNQATMITNDQQLGEFVVSVNVDRKKLNADGLFVYDKNDPEFERLVSVDGDSYIVPRSFTGTTDAANYQPTWGTGQYRIEMEISESCRIVDEYYQIRESGNGRAVAFTDATPGKRKWDKAKWKTEWKAMNVRRKGDSLLKNVWNCVVTAYKGSGWMATLTDPVTTALYSYETKKLDEWTDDLHDSWFSGESPALPSASPATPSAPGNGKPKKEQ